MILGARGQSWRTGTRAVRNLACLHYQWDVHCFFSPVFIHFSTACHMQYAKSHIKKAPMHARARTHTHSRTGTEEPSADSGIDSKNSDLHWSSGFIQLHLPELFVWLCNVKSSVLLLEPFMLSNCFQNSSPRCVCHVPTVSRHQPRGTNVCGSNGRSSLYPGHLPESHWGFWYLMERLKKGYRFNACGTLIVFQGFKDESVWDSLKQVWTRVLGSMSGRWLICKVASGFKLLDMMLSTADSDFMFDPKDSYLAIIKSGSAANSSFKVRLFSIMYAFY